MNSSVDRFADALSKLIDRQHWAYSLSIC